jgi:predicted nuclease of predicted toxin-antitoxin system
LKIRLLLDENTSDHILTDMLRKAGHDAVWLQQVAPYGIPDENVLAIARKEKRAIYTRDRGFLSLATNVKSHAGIILEYRNNIPSDMSKLQIVKALAIIGKQFLSLKNQVVIINSFRKIN